MNVQIALSLLSEKAVFIAEVIENLNKLFDILNSSTFYNSDPNKIAFTNSDEQSAFFNHKKIFAMYKCIKDITGLIKSLKCWIVTINAIFQIWTHLQQSSILFNLLSSSIC